MPSQEHTPRIKVARLDNPEDYDAYLKDHHLGSGRANRCIGIAIEPGEIEVVMDAPYYLRGGIEAEELTALIEHERVELTTAKEDPHLAGTVAEYQFIYDQSGEKGLRQYNSHLCNLMGGRNDIRNAALTKVLGR